MFFRIKEPISKIVVRTCNGIEVKERYRNIEPFLMPDLTRRHQNENSQSYRHDFGPFTEEPPRAKSVLSLNKFKKFKDATR